MANAKEFTEKFTMRATPEFLAELAELGELIGGYPSPTRSDMIRDAVREKLERVRSASGKARKKGRG